MEDGVQSKDVFLCPGPRPFFFGSFVHDFAQKEEVPHTSNNVIINNGGRQYVFLL